MTTAAKIEPSSAYRTPGRQGPKSPTPSPPLRRLLSPLRAGAIVVVGSIVPVLIVNDVIRPSVAAGTHLVPFFDDIVGAAAFAMLASFLVFAVVMARKVGPLLRGVRLRTKMLYVLASVFAQCIVVFGGEAVIFFDRGRLRLAEPAFRSATGAPDGRTAYVYTRGLSCGYTVYVSEKDALVMRQMLEVTGHCASPLPRVRWNADGTVALTDADGIELHSEPTEGFFGRSGC